MTDADESGQDQADRGQQLEDPEGLDEAGTDVAGPLPAGDRGQLFLGHERLADAAGQRDEGEQAGDDPQCEVHGVLLEVSVIDLKTPRDRSL
jgi:hypothetical protein